MKKTTVFTIVLGSGVEMKITASTECHSGSERDQIGFESVSQNIWEQLKSLLDMYTLKSIENVPERRDGVAADDYIGLYRNNLIDRRTFWQLTGYYPEDYFEDGDDETDLTKH